MKKLPITKEAFERSNYFKNKYGKLEYVSESGKVFKTNKGRILMFKEWTSPRKTVQKIKSGELFQKQMPSLEKAIKKFLDSDGVKGQAGTWVLISNENGDIELYEHYGYLVGTIIDGHMIWRDNEEYYVSETYSNMILKSLYDGGLIDKYTLKESTKKFSKESKKVNEGFFGDLGEEIGDRIDSGVSGIRKFFHGKPKFKEGDSVMLCMIEWHPGGVYHGGTIVGVKWGDNKWYYKVDFGENSDADWWPEDALAIETAPEAGTEKLDPKALIEKYPEFIKRAKTIFGKKTRKELGIDESTKKFAKEGTESNPRFKCMEGDNEYVDEIRVFRDDVVSALKKCYSHEYGVEPDMMDEKSILVSDLYAGLDYKIDISVPDEVDM